MVVWLVGCMVDPGGPSQATDIGVGGGGGASPIPPLLPGGGPARFYIKNSLLIPKSYSFILQIPIVELNDTKIYNFSKRLSTDTVLELLRVFCFVLFFYAVRVITDQRT